MLSLGHFLLVPLNESLLHAFHNTTIQIMYGKCKQEAQGWMKEKNEKVERSVHCRPFGLCLYKYSETTKLLNHLLLYICEFIIY